MIKEKISYWLSVWFGAGLLPKAPGTWGSLVAALMGGMVIQNFDIDKMIIFIVLVFFVGVWAADNYQKQTGEHDSGEIVIDEVVGQWIALIPLYFIAIFQSLWLDVILAFLLFRVFDILKPWPIGWMDKNIKGGMGVMLDDIAAGIMALVVFIGMAYFI